MSKPVVKERVELAADILPELDRILVGRTITRVDWHDSHGDVIVLYLDDGMKFSVATTATMNLRDGRVKSNPDQLYMAHVKAVTKRYEPGVDS
jgi:hypothetical protein